jgi:release factor glutamine methyltransferase
MTEPTGRAALDDGVVARILAEAGCVAPEAEAAELARAAGDGRGSLDDMVERRVRGEPLAWIVGSAEFCGLRLGVAPGVYVPRPHTEALAMRAASLLPAEGIAVDLCTGCGAVAAVLRRTRPRARVLATDADPAAVACARDNGVEALLGDLDEPLPPSLAGRVDVLTAVVPYVPTEALHLLPVDVREHEPRAALDGGPRGLRVLERVVASAARWLRPGAWVLLELGGDQADPVSAGLAGAGLIDVAILRDDEGDDRAVLARRAG